MDTTARPRSLAAAVLVAAILPVTLVASASPAGASAAGWATPGSAAATTSLSSAAAAPAAAVGRRRPPQATVRLSGLTAKGTGVVRVSVPVAPRYRAKTLVLRISGTGVPQACSAVAFTERRASHALACPVRGLTGGTVASVRVVLTRGRTTVLRTSATFRVTLPQATTTPAPTATPSLLPNPSTVPGSGTCSLAGTLRTCELWARTGSLGVGGGTGIASFPVWMFATSGGGGAPSFASRPVLVARVGETLRLRVHHQLPQPSGGTNPLTLEVPGLPVPSTAPITAGGVANFDFGTLSQAGSFVYQAGQTPMVSRQLAMGLSGLLVVRPANYHPSVVARRTAYGQAAPFQGMFDQEASVLFNEFDPAFNATMANATAWTSDLTRYRPTVVAVNGRVFNPASPGAGAVTALPGQVLMLRHANLGLRDRAAAMTDSRLTLRARDGRPLVQLSSDGSLSVPSSRDLASVYLTPGGTADTFTTLTAGPGSRRLLVGDAGASNGTGARSGLGGGVFAIDVGGSPGSAAGPATRSVTVTPNQLRDVPSLHVVATFSAPVSALEYSIDAPAADGTGTAVVSSGTTVAFDIPMATFTAAVQAGALATGRPVPGEHVVWVHGLGAVWGAYAADQVAYQPDGAVSTANSLTPSSLGGTVPGLPDVPSPEYGIDPAALVRGDAVLTGTAAASLLGWRIWDAQWCLSDTPPSGQDPCPSGQGGDLARVPGGPSDSEAVVSYAVVVPKALTDPLVEGLHPVWVRLLEGPDGPSGTSVPPWSAWDNGSHSSHADLVVDTTAPAVSALALSPDPNNGYQGATGNLGFLDSVQLDATLTDPALGGGPAAPGSGVQVAEFFVAEQPDADQFGTGAELAPLDGAWGSTSEVARGQVPLAVLRAQPDGTVTVYVHARDVAGNWGPLEAVSLTLDTTPPVVSSAVRAGTTLTFSAHDPGAVASDVVAAEWVDPGNDPGAGKGTAVAVVAGNPVTDATAPVPAAPAAVALRVRDAAGSWSPLVTVTEAP